MAVSDSKKLAGAQASLQEALLGLEKEWGEPLRISSGFREGDKRYHGKGMAADILMPPEKQVQFAAMARKHGFGGIGIGGKNGFVHVDTAGERMWGYLPGTEQHVSTAAARAAGNMPLAEGERLPGQGELYSANQYSSVALGGSQGKGLGGFLKGDQMLAENQRIAAGIASLAGQMGRAVADGMEEDAYIYRLRKEGSGLVG